MRRQAGLLVRISDDRTGEGLGVERQEQDCRELADRRGWDVIRVYRENDTSAFKRRKVALPDGTTALRVVRPAFRQLLGDLTSGTIGALVAYDLDRVARDPRDLEDLIDAVEGRQAPAVSVTGSLDLGSDAGITMARVQVAIANKSSRDTSRRVRRAMLDLAERGAAHGGSRPFGYDDDRVTEHPTEGDVVRWVYAQALAGRSQRSIAVELAAVAPQRRWDSDSVRRLLTSGRYAGLREHQGEIIGPAQWDAVIDRHTWDRVQAVLGAASHPLRLVGGPRKYLLTGLLVCHQCGGTLYPRRNADRQRFGCLPKSAGGCAGSVVVYEPAEALLVELALARLRELDVAPAAEDPTAALRADLAAVEEQERQLGEAFGSGGQDMLAFRTASATLSRRASDLRRRVGEVEQQARLADPVAVADAWGGYDLGQRRAVLDLLIERVVVGPGRNGGPRFDPDRLSVVWR